MVKDMQLLINIVLMKNNLLYQTGTRGDLESSLLDNRALSRIWEILIFPIQIPIFPTVDMPFLLKVKGPHVVTVATVDRQLSDMTIALTNTSTNLWDFFSSYHPVTKK